MEVCSGETGHAESVQVVFEPAKIDFKTLCIFFFNMHNPTTLNMQGGDIGTQYRSGIYATTELQLLTALAVKEELQPQFSNGIVTEI